MSYNIKELVKDRAARFLYYREKVFYYEIVGLDKPFKFTVPLEDIGTATIQAEERAIFFMRWIRRRLEEIESSGCY